MSFVLPFFISIYSIASKTTIPLYVPDERIEKYKLTTGCNDRYHADYWNFNYDFSCNA